MIEMLRVDHRLLHGQIAYAWTSHLNADCILIANDDLVSDDLRKAAVKMAKSPQAKLVIKNIETINSGVTDKYHLLVIVESVDDAVKLVKGCPVIRTLNLGNVKAREGAKQIEKTFNLMPDEEKALRELSDQGVDIFIQRVPEVKSIDFKKI